MKELIYIVEDEESIRELYIASIESAGFDVVCYEDGLMLFEALGNTKPNLIILDIMLAGLDGFEILRTIKGNKATADIPCIMVSAKGEELSKVKGLNLGADDYISKPFGILELIARIKANLRKAPLKITSYKDIIIDDGSHTIKINDTLLSLTKKEYDLLKLLVKNNKNVVLREDIMNIIWGYNMDIETRTLDMHIKELRKKLAECDSKAEIETIRSVGYLLK